MRFTRPGARNRRARNRGGGGTLVTGEDYERPGFGRVRLQPGAEITDTGDMTRFQTSWEIAKRSWAVLKSDKSLAWFPVLSFIGSLAVVGAIAGLVLATGTND